MACTTMSKLYPVGGDGPRLNSQSLYKRGKVSSCTTDTSSDGGKLGIGPDWSIAVGTTSTVREHLES